MELQIGLAMVDEMNGGEETRRRMDGWMHREAASGKRLRALGARVLVALAARLDSAVLTTRQDAGMLTPANQS